MAVTFRLYTHVMRLGEGDRDRLKALVNAGFRGITPARRPPTGSSATFTQQPHAQAEARAP
jgi:hypothetical protein